MSGKFKKNDYDDSLVRKFGIKFFKEQFNITLEEHTNKFAIDLINPLEINCNVELERGKWKNNFWDNPSYCSKTQLSFKTINIPIRKHKYWYDGSEPNNKNHIFLRTNIDFTQVILIRPDVIKDPKKINYTSFIPGNSGRLELFMSFRKEDVETYNLIDGKYILEKNEL